LRGKKMLTAITTGGPEDSYTTEGFNRFTIRQLLAPFEQTAHLCGMEYLPPYVIHGIHRLTQDEVNTYTAEYHRLILALRDGTADWQKARNWPRLNHDLSQILPPAQTDHA